MCCYKQEEAWMDLKISVEDCERLEIKERERWNGDEKERERERERERKSCKSRPNLGLGHRGTVGLVLMDSIALFISLQREAITPCDVPSVSVQASSLLNPTSSLGNPTNHLFLQESAV